MMPSTGRRRDPREGSARARCAINLIPLDQRSGQRVPGERHDLIAREGGHVLRRIRDGRGTHGLEGWRQAGERIAERGNIRLVAVERPTGHTALAGVGDCRRELGHPPPHERDVEHAEPAAPVEISTFTGIPDPVAVRIFLVGIRYEGTVVDGVEDRIPIHVVRTLRLCLECDQQREQRRDESDRAPGASGEFIAMPFDVFGRVRSQDDRISCYHEMGSRCS